MKQKFSELMSICVVMSSVLAFGEVVSLLQVFRTLGQPISKAVSGVSYVNSSGGVSDFLYGTDMRTYPYDGISDGNDEHRWMGVPENLRERWGVSSWTAIRVPDLSSSRFYPRFYRLHGLNPPGANGNFEALPLEWKLLGVGFDGTTNELDHVTANDVVWSATEQEVKERTIVEATPRAYREFIWTPLKNNGHDRVVGLVELEIFGEVSFYNPNIEAMSLQQVFRALGQPISNAVSGVSYVGPNKVQNNFLYGTDMRTYPYDGISDGSDEHRWMGVPENLRERWGVSSWTAIRVPDLSSSRFYPRFYRLHGLNPTGAEGSFEALPLEWKLLGVGFDGTTNELDHVAAGDVAWSATEQEVKERTIVEATPRAYREFIWTPLKNNGHDRVVGLVELEIFGDVSPRNPNIEVVSLQQVFCDLRQPISNAVSGVSYVNGSGVVNNFLYNNTDMRNYPYNGISDGSDEHRWMGVPENLRERWGVSSWTAIRVPDLSSSRFYPRFYRLHGLNPTGAEGNFEALPREWKLLGVGFDGMTNELDHVTAGDVAWSAAEQEVKERTIVEAKPRGYREFIWMPLKNNGHNRLVGLVELEIFGKVLPYYPGTMVIIR